MSGSQRESGLERFTLMPIVMRALLEAGAGPVGDPDEVGTGRIVTEEAGVVAGLPVAKETFGRLGVRFRPAVEEGQRIRSGDVVAELGGPLAAMRGAAPTALGFMVRMSSVASGVKEPEPDDLLDRYASGLRLSTPEVMGDDGPTFRLIVVTAPET